MGSHWFWSTAMSSWGNDSARISWPPRNGKYLAYSALRDQDLPGYQVSCVFFRIWIPPHNGFGVLLVFLNITRKESSISKKTQPDKNMEPQKLEPKKWNPKMELKNTKKYDFLQKKARILFAPPGLVNGAKVDRPKSRTCGFLLSIWCIVPRDVRT